MSNDERADSLAAQAAAWVPPWERAPRTPDRGYQAAAEEEARAGGGAADSGPAFDAPSDTESIDESGLSDDDDDFDPTFEGPDPEPAGAEEPVDVAEREPAGAEEPVDVAEREPAGVEEPVDATEREPAGVDGADPGPAGIEEPVDGTDPEPAGVDEPIDGAGREPVDVAPGPELPLPEAIEDAVDAAAGDEPGLPVDAPLPADGDDAGDVFDQAADDDVSDDGEMDLPFAAEVPVSLSADGPDTTEDDDIDQDELETIADDPDDPLQPDDPDVPDIPDDPGLSAAEVPAFAAEASVAAAERPAVAAEVPAFNASASPEAAVPGQTRRAAQRAVAVEEAQTRTAENDLPGLTDDAELAGALEAIMLVVDEPVAELQLAQILEQPTERVADMLDDLSARYTAAGHGFDLRRVAGGWRLYTRPEYAAYVERFVLDGQSVRLTQAALETLAVVAYKQPVTRSRISAIRGVNCDGVMRTLVTRGLIEECGTESETGAHLYRTTGLFLEKLGLNSVDQLPPLAPFLPDDVEEVLDASG